MIRATAAPRIPHPIPSPIPRSWRCTSRTPPGTLPAARRVSSDPPSESEAAAFLQATAGETSRYFLKAARSSLTGGAVPSGEVIVSVEKLDAIGPVEAAAGHARVRVAAGVRLDVLQRHLASGGTTTRPCRRTRKRWSEGRRPRMPAVPRRSSTGSHASGCAASASCFRTATCSRSSAVRRSRRGRGVHDRPFGWERGGRSRSGLDAASAEKDLGGYHASDPMDLLDLFVGAEGTLGLITEVELDLIPLPRRS